MQSPVNLGGWGLPARTEARPTYYVYQLYQRFGDQLLYASSDDADLSIYAARRDDGALTLIIVNLSPEEKIKTVTNGEAPRWPAASISLYVLP